MKLTDDESRALAFIAGLLFLSLAVRVAATPDPASPAGANAIDLAAHVAATAGALAEAERRGMPLGAGERVDPNAADAVELDRLPRVGPALAARIVEDREANGLFRSLEDLGRVRGVGDRMLEEIAPFVTLPRRRSGSGTDAGAGSGVGSTAGAGGGGSAERALWRPQVLDDGGAGAGDGGAAGSGPVVDLNTADAAALTTLPGIGPALAARIVAHRDSAGPFPDLDALTAVRGIGPATVARLRDRVRVP